MKLNYISLLTIEIKTKAKIEASIINSNYLNAYCVPGTITDMKYYWITRFHHEIILPL